MGNPQTIFVWLWPKIFGFLFTKFQKGWIVGFSEGKAILSIKKNPHFLSSTIFFSHFWQAQKYKSTWKYSCCVMTFQSKNKIYSRVFACCSTSQCQYIKLTLSLKCKGRLVFLPLHHCKYHYGLLPLIPVTEEQRQWLPKQSVLLPKGVSCPVHTPPLWLLECSCRCKRCQMRRLCQLKTSHEKKGKLMWAWGSGTNR